MQHNPRVRIAIIDDRAGRASIIQEGLAEAGLTDTVVLTEREGLLARLEAVAPEVVLIDLENPSRDVLEDYFAMSRALARPIAMFVDQSDEESIVAAIDAGVSAYIVDGLTKSRIKPVLEVAVRRFQAFARLQQELHDARSALAERAVIDRAKAILIARRGLDEPAAYALLRKHAMSTNRRIAEVAEAIVTAEALLGDIG
jgi:response regulator NasT